MDNRVFEILKELVAFKSTSYSAAEVAPAKWFEEFFKNMPYFKEHPELTGLADVPNDPFGRKVPWALLLGKKKTCVVSAGHFDVVSSEDYGKAEEFAYKLGDTTIETMLKDMPLSDPQRKDLESGEWFWGRGAADMKGGLAIHAALFEEYAQKAYEGTLEGSLLFVPVPDEECYSVGMRTATPIIKDLMKKYDLDYKILVIPEPTADTNMVQVLSKGSVGKTMPAILVQGKKGHAGHCYGGFSALGIISDIYQRTNGSLEFSDVYENEATVPPTWAQMRDMKHVYDVSIPHRASGYFTAFCYDSTPEDLMNKLKKIATDAFVNQVNKIDGEYQEYKKINKFATMPGIHYDPVVMSFEELCEEARKKDKEGFEKFYAELYKSSIKDIEEGRSNFPDATLSVMEKVLDFTGILYPITIIGFAPPYYPPVHSDLVKGKEKTGAKAFEFLQEVNKEWGQEMTYENYFMGISDLSYGAVTAPFDYNQFTKNTPLYGDAYALDFEAQDEIALPGIIYGPIGRDYHTFAERVHKKSLLEIVPDTTRKLFEYFWED